MGVLRNESINTNTKCTKRTECTNAEFTKSRSWDNKPRWTDRIAENIIGVDMNREEVIKALLENEHNPVKEQEALEATSDVGLTALQAHCTTLAENKAADEVELTEEQFLEIAPDTIRDAVSQARAAKKAPTEEEYLAMAPDSIKTLVAEKKATDAKQKVELVKALKAGQAEYTEAELVAMTNNQLLRLARLAKLDEPEEDVDFSVRPRAASSGADNAYENPPDGYALALAARKAQTVN
jgi:hypothetical protein